MIVYLAGFSSIDKFFKEPTKDIYLLSSFWEHKSGKFGEYVLQDRHILDSGAFSAINDKTGKYKNFDWDNYVKKYIAFIKKTNQKLFFELDIDCVVGLKKVEYYRKKIEDAVGRQPIVCWHANRGADYWIKCCEDYPYVALGTTKASNAGQKIRKDPTILNWFINHAHKNNAKIHGLGFTETRWLSKLKFDSIDSTSWLTTRFNMCYKFNKTYMKPFRKNINNTKYRVKNSKEYDKWQLMEWVKFQKYAEKNL